MPQRKVKRKLRRGRVLGASLVLILVLSIILFAATRDRSPKIIGISDKISTEQVGPAAPEYTTATLCVAGDIVCHTGLNTTAYRTASNVYDYTGIMAAAKPYIDAADYAMVDIETTFAEKDYTGYPCFKSPDGLAKSLADIGFDLVTTASNHSCDAGKSGVFRTLDVLDQYGLAHVGTYRTQEEAEENQGIYVANIKGITIAFLNYTYGTNGISCDSYKYAVNIFNSDYKTTMRTIDYDMLQTKMDYAKSLDTDLIAVAIHWGEEYRLKPTELQKELADWLFEAGADLILGGHPHVPEPMELRTITNEDGSTRTGYLVYCMGNFISCQDSDYTNLTTLLNFQFKKNINSGRTVIESVDYVPMYMMDSQDDAVSTSDRYRLLDIHKTLDAYDSGSGSASFVSGTLYRNLKQGLSDIHEIAGDTMDRFATSEEASESALPETE